MIQYNKISELPKAWEFCTEYIQNCLKENFSSLEEFLCWKKDTIEDISDLAAFADDFYGRWNEKNEPNDSFMSIADYIYTDSVGHSWRVDECEVEYFFDTIIPKRDFVNYWNRNANWADDVFLLVGENIYYLNDCQDVNDKLKFMLSYYMKSKGIDIQPYNWYYNEEKDYWFNSIENTKIRIVDDKKDATNDFDCGSEFWYLKEL